MEIPFLSPINIESSPTVNHIVPISPHPSNILLLEKVFAMTVQEIPISLFRGNRSDRNGGNS